MFHDSYQHQYSCTSCTGINYAAEESCFWSVWFVRTSSVASDPAGLAYSLCVHCRSCVPDLPVFPHNYAWYMFVSTNHLPSDLSLFSEFCPKDLKLYLTIRKLQRPWIDIDICVGTVRTLCCLCKVYKRRGLVVRIVSHCLLSLHWALLTDCLPGQRAENRWQAWKFCWPQTHWLFEPFVLHSTTLVPFCTEMGAGLSFLFCIFMRSCLPWMERFQLVEHMKKSW